MKRFEFKLEALLELRKRKEDEIKQLLGKKNHEILSARKELFALKSALEELQRSEKKKRTERLDAVELRYAVAYRFKLKKDLLGQARKIDELGAQAAEIRKLLVKAKQQVRAIEVVREHQYEAWRKEYKRQEMRFIDDVSQQGFIRKTRAELVEAKR
jgi:flagellar protein FliJ